MVVSNKKNNIKYLFHCKVVTLLYNSFVIAKFHFIYKIKNKVDIIFYIQTCFFNVNTVQPTLLFFDVLQKFYKIVKKYRTRKPMYIIKCYRNKNLSCKVFSNNLYSLGEMCNVWYKFYRAFNQSY